MANPNYLDSVSNYLQNLNYTLPVFHEEMSSYAKENLVPIVPLETAKLLQTLVLAKQPQNILEIGSAIGYSALWLAEGFGGEKIIALEMSKANHLVAKPYLAKYDPRQKIDFQQIDAKIWLEKNNQNFDFIFVDACKGDYPQYLEKSLAILNPGGIIVFDNLFWRGQVIDIPEKNARYQKAADKLKKFNKLFSEHPLLNTVILPVGDGVGIGVKKNV